MRKPQIGEYGISSKDIVKVDFLIQKIENKSVKFAAFSLIFLSVLSLTFFNLKQVLLFYTSIFAPILAYTFFEWLFKLLLYKLLFSQEMHFVRENTEKYIADLKKYNEWFVRTEAEFWFSLDGHTFEAEVAKLFNRFGYDAILTKGSGDEGVDIFLKKDGKTCVVQCKAHKKPVGPSVARDLYGSMNHFKADEAILVALGGVTKGVKDFIRDKEVGVISINDLVRLQIKLEDQ